MSLSPIFKITEMAAAQAQPHLTVNEAIRIMEAMAQCGVTSRIVSDPPAEIVDGDRFIVASGATTFWSEHVDHIAIGVGGQWLFVEPLDGFEVWVVDEGRKVRFRTGSPNGWELVGEGGGGSGGLTFDQSVTDNPGATEDDYDPSGWNAGDGMNRMRLTPAGGGSSITGVEAGSTVDGQAVLFCNDSAVDNLTFPHEGAGSTPVNRFQNVVVGDVVLLPYECRIGVRTGNRWRFT